MYGPAGFRTGAGGFFATVRFTTFLAAGFLAVGFLTTFFAAGLATFTTFFTGFFATGFLTTAFFGAADSLPPNISGAGPTRATVATGAFITGSTFMPPP